MTADPPGLAFAYDLRPVRVVFGHGALAQLPAELAALDRGRVLLLATAGRAETLARLRGALGARVAGVFDQAAEHVPAAVVERALAEVKRANPDVCVSVGGGSAIGLGKAIARDTGLMLAAVPTTYAGSEMTSIWGITGETGKRTGREARVAPRLVLYDPELTLSLPPAVSAASGMNAMAHAAEALYAAHADPGTLALAEEAARILATSLPRVVAAPGDRAARAEALAGAHLAGRALELAAMGLHHRICHVLGGTFGLPHARTHAIVLPHVVAFNAPAATVAMRRLARALGADEAAAGLARLNRALGLTGTLGDLGLRPADIPRAAAEVVAAAYANPRPVTAEAVHAILEAALRGEVSPRAAAG